MFSGWIVYEQVAISSFDVRDWDLSKVNIFNRVVIVRGQKFYYVRLPC